MAKLIKYEMKGSFKEFLGLILTIIAANVLLIFKKGVWKEETIILLSCAIVGISLVIIFSWNIKVFSKELNDDTGYLLYTLPVSSNSLLVSKLVTAFIQFLSILILNFIFIYFMLTSKISINLIGAIRSVNPIFITIKIFNSIVGYVGFLCVIYFSITLSKVALKRKKKLSKLGSWIVFIGICLGISSLSEMLERLIPYSIPINVMKFNSNITINSFKVQSLTGDLYIVSIILDVVVAIVFFLLTSYLIREKLDL
ncbi:hypothetical protein [Clostridium rectalis]|uniref:hypothetical protein n=1 Tax=Clostridium rectalis TaxID=2040295 RepID=UPI000F63A3A4|nr:hypothetical protein [Clostridium rectalis]